MPEKPSPETESADMPADVDMARFLDRAEAELTVQFGDAQDNEITAEIFRVGVQMRAAVLTASEVT